MFRKTPSRGYRAPSISSDSGAESPITQLRKEMDDAHENDEAFESSEEDSRPTSDSNMILSEDPFGNEESQRLFESIDKLRKCGAGQDLDLPQLVIVGKQSAGKSSLLQSLTDIPFPVGSRLCTQFAMRIVSRRTEPGTQDTIYASIEPGDINPFSIKDDDIRVKEFGTVISDFTPEAFENLIWDAKVAMGIDNQGTSEDRNYSSKVLKIELSGPKRSHFGILDLPGVFNAEIGGVSRREKDGVTTMVTSYMNKPENIIICVADASGDIANENILPLARDIDSSRIVGVFTKCDKADPASDIVNHVNNPDSIGGKNRRWYVVQNKPGKSEIERSQAETALFSQSPWTDISEKQCGTAELKKYLATLLCRRIRDAFPGMANTVTRLLDAEKARRKGMGESRVDHLHKQAYLMKIVDAYRTLALQSLRSPTDLEDDGMKLRGRIVDEKLGFEKEMKMKGHFYDFVEIGNGEKKVREELVDGDSDSDSAQNISSNPAPFTFGSSRDLSPSPLTTPRPRGAAIRRRGLHTPSQSPPRFKKEEDTTQPKRTALYTEIHKQITTNRGEELPGMLNPAVLKPLLRTQTSKWPILGESYLSRLLTITKYVALAIFDKACVDTGATERTRAGLRDRLLRMVEVSRVEVIGELRALCDKNARMALQTDTDDFMARVRAAQMMRFADALQRYKTSNPSSNFIGSLTKDGALGAGPDVYAGWTIVDPSTTAALFNALHSSSAQNIEDEIHDLLKAYYEIALKNFMHDVRHNITEPFLQDPKGPLLGLGTDFVLGLSEEEVEVLGGEDESLVVGRREADERIRRLEVAGSIARAP